MCNAQQSSHAIFSELFEVLLFCLDYLSAAARPSWYHWCFFVAGVCLALLSSTPVSYWPVQPAVQQVVQAELVGGTFVTTSLRTRAVTTAEKRPCCKSEKIESDLVET